MRASGRLLVAALSLALSVPAGAGPAPRRPNIVILLADDWGFTDVGAFGGEMATPHIDALAASGVRFANFHVAGSCSPTRAMLQTGVGNHRAGLGNMPETIPPEHEGRPGYDTVMNLRVVTIADMLRAAGYRTYLTGKWHLGKTPDRLPHARGYDRAFSLADAGADNFEQRPIEGMYERAEWTENGHAARLPTPFYASTFIIDRMIAYIEADRASGQPFLASVNFLANHIPVQAPDQWLARYASRYGEGWDGVRAARRQRAAALGIIPADSAMVRMPTTRNWMTLDADERAREAAAMRAYGAMASAMDAEVGRLVAYLRERGDYENTIFVFL